MKSADEEVCRAVEVAVVEAHYPLIDTAELYGNEELWTNNLHPDRSEAATRACLKRLKLDKVDLLLAHMPITRDAADKEHDESVTVEDVWRGLEAIYTKGLARAIGVSNFSVEQIERIMAIVKVPIHNAQNELYLYWPQQELAEVCRSMHGISLTSYGSLGSPGRVNYTLPTGEKMDWAEAPSALDDPVVKKLAVKYGKSPAHVR